MEPIRTLQKSTHFKKIYKNKNDDNYIWMACSSGDIGGIKMNLMDFNDSEQNKIKCESIKLSHFLRVLKNSRPSVSPREYYCAMPL